LRDRERRKLLGASYGVDTSTICRYKNERERREALNTSGLRKYEEANLAG